MLHEELSAMEAARTAALAELDRLHSASQGLQPAFVEQARLTCPSASVNSQASKKGGTQLAGAAGG